MQDDQESASLLVLLVPSAPEDFFDEPPTEEVVERAIIALPFAAANVAAYWRTRRREPVTFVQTAPLARKQDTPLKGSAPRLRRS